MLAKILPKSLFGILLMFITALFVIYALVTGSMTWMDAKQQEDAVFSNNITQIMQTYEAGVFEEITVPSNLKPGLPHLQKKIDTLNEEDLSLKLYHLKNDDHANEFWLQVNNEDWFAVPVQATFALWLKSFAPQLVLMGSLIALSALFLSQYIKQPLAKLTHALSSFQHKQAVPALQVSGPKELKQVMQQVSSMMKEISSFEKQREWVLAGVAHDIRTPLSRMRIAIEMIPQLADDKRHALINDIEQINHLQEQFLNYAQAQQNDKIQAVDINGMVTDCASHYPAQALVLHLSEEKIIVKANATQLYRAVDNILANAFKYGKPMVRIITSLESDFAVITVSDDGEGVPEASLQYLTQPLYRCDIVRSNCEGTGLGLSIVERCIKNLGGELEFSNTPGLRVVIKLPLSH